MMKLITLIPLIWEDGGYEAAVKFEDKASAEDFMKDELDKNPDLEIEVLPVKEAFAFLEDEESLRKQKLQQIGFINGN